MIELLLATHNAHKTREFAQLLDDRFKIVDLDSFPEIGVAEETGRTFAENAILKALGASKKYVDLVVADDSGLEVKALDGAPGIFSARYAGENASDEQNIEKLLRELGETEKRNARFCCVIALARAGRLLGTFEGIVEGKIVDLVRLSDGLVPWRARGANGFGYDPIFIPDGFDKTFAELGVEAKNQISHRAKAIVALREALRDGVSI